MHTPLAAAAQEAVPLWAWGHRLVYPWVGFHFPLLHPSSPNPQAFYRPKKVLDLLCRQPTSGLWIYSESQIPSSSLGFFVCLEVCCITRSESSG